MDHQKAASKSKNKILKFLPRAASVSFQNPPPYSPTAKDKRSSGKTHKSHLGYGFSGPLVSTIPARNRREVKNESPFTTLYEPTSPRVSCMGQVKCKHYKQKASTKTTKKAEEEPEKSSTKKPTLRSIFGGSRRKSTAPTPSLSTMKRFASGRDAFANFDWTTQVAPVDPDCRSCDGVSDDEEVMMPCSAPIVMRNKGVGEEFVRVGGVVSLEPRKEINLWKRRTLPQPKPLQLHVI